MQIFSNPLTGSTRAAAQAADAGTSSGSDASSSSSTNSATISANDFLQLLVTEMQNQDPTADTDPNEYINQLVQVNSLEQLISINQDLTPTAAAASSETTGQPRLRET
jgi:flagellar basal-body rod modification protein FlgD